MVHVILDNYAAHKHPKVRAWLDRHERFVFHFTPTSCSWLNAVEGFFAKLSRRRLKRGVFRSVVDLQAAINRFLAETNAAVPIPKKSGGVRVLGVPTVSDRIAQTAVKMWLEPRLDPIFHRDSYGYRPGKSALEAIAVPRRRCWDQDRASPGSYPLPCACLVESSEVRKYSVSMGVIGHAKDFAGSCGVNRANRACVRPEGRDRGGECEWVDFFNKGDFAGVASLYTEDATAFPPGAGMMKGRAAIEAMWKGAAEQVGDPKFITLEVKPLVLLSQKAAAD